MGSRVFLDRAGAGKKKKKYSKRSRYTYLEGAGAGKISLKRPRGGAGPFYREPKPLKEIFKNGYQEPRARTF